ncbi:putative wall-associated receptor kinase, galacturonan-binding domain-containing protein [Lupinus albus]|uniref:Putative wall-associated receptor kinase, galacturonan-binding domain-containing protein n=1 Tax=Lupinus albus TaxID=3870 RepID=A0A6A4Q3J2_LUPAL|nr:putative wall-associated receptor kinase, galacturonan-binding domain-containing protein [Lupinus albus]
MILHFTFHIIILIILPLYSLAAEIIAQPGCDSKCGNVSIPYPFGMKDPNCYVDKWFEIECRYNSTSNSGHKPYLKSLNLEVSYLSFDDYNIWIRNPVFYSNCDGKTNKPVIDLKGSPFRYSQDKNIFMAYGCSKLAFMHSDGSTIGGCVSICDANDQSLNGRIDCNGISCCETSLPLHLSEYNVTLSDLNNKSMRHDCNYAFIIALSVYQHAQNE